MKESIPKLRKRVETLKEAGHTHVEVSIDGLLQLFDIADRDQKLRQKIRDLEHDNEYLNAAIQIVY